MSVDDGQTDLEVQRLQVRLRSSSSNHDTSLK